MLCWYSEKVLIISAPTFLLLTRFLWVLGDGGRTGPRRMVYNVDMSFWRIGFRLLALIC